MAMIFVSQYKLICPGLPVQLRAAVNLARLWKGQDKHHAAHELLAPVYDCFTEGFDTDDLKDAMALLGELAWTSMVRYVHNTACRNTVCRAGFSTYDCLPTRWVFKYRRQLQIITVH